VAGVRAYRGSRTVIRRNVHFWYAPHRSQCSEFQYGCRALEPRTSRCRGVAIERMRISAFHRTAVLCTVKACSPSGKQMCVNAPLDPRQFASRGGPHAEINKSPASPIRPLVLVQFGYFYAAETPPQPCPRLLLRPTNVGPNRRARRCIQNQVHLRMPSSRGAPACCLVISASSVRIPRSRSATRQIDTPEIITSWSASHTEMLAFACVRSGEVRGNGNFEQTMHLDTREHAVARG